MVSVFLTFISLVPCVWSRCETDCESLSSLLSECSLPPISSAWVDASREERNLTGLPELPTLLSLGPSTRFIANYSQAECFCVDARTEFTPCHRCRSSGDELVIGDELDKTRHIDSDCESFGYYSDANLSYPSTTLLSSLPFETELPSNDEGDALCDEMCGPMRAHIETCNLTSLDVRVWPDNTQIPENQYSYEHSAAVLLNRTAAECLCTLQVLRRTAGCFRCLSVKEEENAQPNLKWRVEQYGYECHEYGYWTDSEWILPSYDEFYDDGPTGSLTSPVHSPSPTDDNGMSGRDFRSMGLIAGLSVFTSLFVLP